MIDINWEAVTIVALTTIRMTWPVTKLQSMAAEGHETPASGDTITTELAFYKGKS